MILERFPELLKLSEDEKQQLCSELRGTFFIDEPVTDPDLIAILEARHQHYLAHPETARPWSEVRAELRAKYIEGRQE